MAVEHKVRVTFSTRTVAVLDNFLNQELWTKVLESLQKEECTTDHTGEVYSRAWDWTGCPAWSSTAYLLSEKPENWATPLGMIFQEAGKQLLGKVICESWDDIRIHLQLAKRGVKLDWHLDRHCVGAFTWYAHRDWKPEWGGDLLLPETDDVSKLPKHNCFAQGFLDGCQSSYGVFVQPLPNRCVVLAPNVLHSTTRIDPDAGNAVRLAVVGFLTKKAT